MADNFYARYPSTGGGGVTSLNTLTGALTLVGGTGVTITPSGSTITIDATGTGANTALSNLTNPTAVNQDLNMSGTKTLILPNNVALRALDNTLVARDIISIDAFNRTSIFGVGAGNILVYNNVIPSTPDAISLGVVGDPFSDVVSDKFEVCNSGVSLGELDFTSSSPSGSGTGISLRTNDVNRNLFLFTTNSAVADANPTRNVMIETGNKTAGTGNSGSITITTGNSVGGTSGTIIAISGLSTGGGDSGQVQYASGDSASGTSGNVALFSGATSGPNPSGGVQVTTGSNVGTSQSGPLQFNTGDANAGSGPISAFTGDNNGVASPNDTGEVSLATGSISDAGSSGNTGSIELTTGSNSGSGLRGDLNIDVARLFVPMTTTPAGTTGAQTINTMSGTVNFATGTSSLTVTCNKCFTTSIVFAVCRTNDASAIIKNVVPINGSFTITLNAASALETSVGFLVIN